MMRAVLAYIRERHAYRAARQAYALGRLESLLAENRQRLAELDAVTTCPWCVEMALTHETCADQASL